MTVLLADHDLYRYPGHPLHFGLFMADTFAAIINNMGTLRAGKRIRAGGAGKGREEKRGIGFWGCKDCGLTVDGSNEETVGARTTDRYTGVSG